MKPLTRQNQEKIKKFYTDEAVWIDDVMHSLYPRMTSFIEYSLTGRMAAAASMLLIRFARLEIVRNQHLDVPDPKRIKKMQIVKKVTVKVMRRGKEVAMKDFPVGVILKHS